jgi:hypothetical protein
LVSSKLYRLVRIPPVSIVIVAAYFDLVFGFHAARLPRDTDHALAAVRIALAADSIVIVFTLFSSKMQIYKHIAYGAAILVLNRLH